MARRRSFCPAAEQLESRRMLAVRALPTVSVADASVTEGHSGSKTLSFVVSLSAAAQQTTSVGYRTVDGTATVAGADYTAKSGTVTFRPGQRTATVAISVRGDRTVEADESLQLVLSSPSNATLGRTTAAGVILDDDAAPRTVSLSAPPAAVSEGGLATFTFTLSRSSSVPVSVSYATGNLTASAGSDFTAATGSLTFAAGETAKTLSVTTRTDTATESDETFQMRIVSASGASVGSPATAVATIKDVPPVTPPPTSTGDWTILVYMTGENLNTYARDDINEMEKALVSMPAGVKIVVSWDQPNSAAGTAYATGGGTQRAWRTYGRSVLKADSSTTSIASTFNLSFGEKNTGDPANLVDFVKWGVQQAPASRYLLQMWGHGAGLDGSQFDSESADDALTIGEFASALASPGMPAIDLVSYDNCLMAMAEVGVAIAPYVGGVFVASEELINGTGQNYVTAYDALKTSPATVTATQIAAGMVASYQTQYQGDIDKCDTFSAASASGYAGLTAALKQFVDATTALTTANRTTLVTAANATVTYDTPSFRDLGSFMSRVTTLTSLPQTVRTAATAVSTALGTLIVGKTADQRSSSGVSIYLPTTSSDTYLASYTSDAAAFCQATGWNTFARWLATGTRAATITDVATAARAVPVRGDVRGSGRAAALNAWAVFAASADSTPSESAKPRRRVFA